MNKDEGLGKRQLIHEKIEVPDGPQRVSRPRLLRLLKENLASYNATIINGRAGSGKTILAADFTRYARRPVSWYKVDAADFNLRDFMQYLLASVRLQRPSIDGGLLQLAAAITGEDAAILAEALVFQLGETQGEPLLIVIEDLHLVYDADWVVPFFRRLLPLLPSDLHVLITCRSMPPTPLWRMRSKQTLLVIDESELAFTQDETIELFKQRGLDERQARFAWIRTKGRSGALANFIERADTSGAATRDSCAAAWSRESREISLPQ
jgi:LuxR family transcriptional regulator, maltose regulon positive regulatory protein